MAITESGSVMGSIGGVGAIAGGGVGVGSCLVLFVVVWCGLDNNDCGYDPSPPTTERKSEEDSVRLIIARGDPFQ